MTFRRNPMRRFTFALIAAIIAVPAFAQEKLLPEAKSGKGELKYVQGIPVLTLEGTPEEIGAQFAELSLKPADKPLLGRVDSYMKQIGWEKQFPAMIKFADIVYVQFPKNNQVELNTACKAAKV